MQGHLLCPPHQGCIPELHVVMLPAQWSCHARDCRHALSRHQQAMCLDWGCLQRTVLHLHKDTVQILRASVCTAHSYGPAGGCLLVVGGTPVKGHGWGSAGSDMVVR